MRTREKPAAALALESTSRLSQPWPMSGFAWSSKLPIEAKMRPSRKSHSSIWSWSLSMSSRKLRRSSCSRALTVSIQPSLRVAFGVDAAEHEQVVFDLVDDQRVDVTLGFGPVGRLARLERDELDQLAGLLGARERGNRLVLLVLARQRVLELVLGQAGAVLGLAVVALGGQLEVRLALLVALRAARRRPAS